MEFEDWIDDYDDWEEECDDCGAIVYCAVDIVDAFVCDVCYSRAITS
jgi:hypothetical protein